MTMEAALLRARGTHPSTPGMELLRDGALAFGLCLTAEHVQAFQTYYCELSTWNRKFNLTAVTRYEDVQIKHFLDSLTCLLALPVPGAESRQPLPDTVPLSSSEAPMLCMDVGTGAGFPGLPVKILRPAMQMTLLDSSRKKVAFLERVTSMLGVAGVSLLCARAEEAGQDIQQRERYDVVLSRAVADMTELVEYCLPLCRKGGRFIAQKGRDIEAEIREAQFAIGLLGGELREVKTVELPGLNQVRSLVLIDKVEQTPAKYPRRPGMPKKRPLSKEG
jgi:16S rRNA (guanine527-N7)-methyltransferase